MASLLARTVHVVISVATLLSGGLEDCLTPSDPSCVSGVAAVSAFARNATGNDPSLVLPFFDKSSPFVQMHPLGWTVNRLVLEHIMGWPVFLSTPVVLTQNSRDFNISSRDLSDLQSAEFPFLLSNVGVPPSNSWSSFTTPIFFDEATGLAVLSVANDNQAFNIPQVDATLALLDYIERINQHAECSAEDTTLSLFDTYVNRTFTERKCWIPIVIYADLTSNFLDWLTPVLNHEHPPALIVTIEEMLEEYAQPVMVQGVWIVSYEEDKDVHAQLTLEIAEGGRQLSNVTLIQIDMQVVPDDLKDATYNDHITRLRELADEATINDPIVGQSVRIPEQRFDTYRRCKAGECEIGNLFNDAARWYTQSDVAFQASGGFRGPGWEAGSVKVSDIWEALPFDNTLCTGVMSGVSLFRLFNYSLAYSTFEGEDTELGDRLLQVSGLRISYNLKLDSTSRLVRMEVWSEVEQNYTQIDRLGLYSFVTDSYNCFGFEEYPQLLGEESLTIPGEKPGSAGDDIIIQTVVADYLTQLEMPYDPSLLGPRLVNRTDMMMPLNLIQTPDSCPAGEYWQADLSSCVTCPTESTVTFLSERLDFQPDELTSAKTIKLVNPALFEVEVVMKSNPAWVLVVSAKFETSGLLASLTGSSSVKLASGETLIMSFQTNTKSLEPGTAQGDVVFEVLDGGKYPGCTPRDASFEIFARKYPPVDLNYLGSLRYVGFSMAALAGLLSLLLTGWVVKYRQIQVVRTLQPTFLGTISMGVFIMALSLVPMSIDDEIASQQITDVSCMSVPWLLSLGFSFSMSALFSKLWRIERLFRETSFGRRVSVGVKDVLGPIAIMIALNVGVLLAWTIVSPLRFQRRSVYKEPWNSYGVCRSTDEDFGLAMVIAVVSINATCLILVSYIAYTVRNVSDEFSESKRVGLALFCWMQLLVVAGPMALLIDQDNPSAKYFLETGVVFAVCVSMLCFIFVPIIWLKRLVSQHYSRRNLAAGSHAASKQGSSASMRLSKQFSLREKPVRVSGMDMAGREFQICTTDHNDANGRATHEIVSTISGADHLAVLNEEDYSEEEDPSPRVERLGQMSSQDDPV